MRESALAILQESSATVQRDAPSAAPALSPPRAPAHAENKLLHAVQTALWRCTRIYRFQHSKPKRKDFESARIREKLPEATRRSCSTRSPATTSFCPGNSSGLSLETCA